MLDFTWRECGVNPSLQFLVDTLWPGGVVPVKVPAMAQIDLFEMVTMIVNSIHALPLKTLETKYDGIINFN